MPNEQTKQELMTVPQTAQSAVSIFADTQSFENAQRMAKALCTSDLVPDTYRGNIANTMIALELSQRVGVSPFMVMQNVNVIKGRPSWSSTFIISVINSCGRFTQLRFKIDGEGDQLGCVAYAKDLKTGDVLTSPKITIAMAKAEGWWSKKNRDGKETSKWQTMPELMMQYRAAAFFGRLYVSDILQGMQSVDEVQDFMDVSYEEVPGTPSPIADINAKVSKKAKPKEEPPVEEAKVVSDDDEMM